MSRHSYTTEYIILYLTTILLLFTKHLVDAAALTKGTDVLTKARLFFIFVKVTR
jgi:hypothetical protein